jgi:hypothetical protein
VAFVGGGGRAVVAIPYNEMCNIYGGGGGVLYRPTQHTPDEGGRGRARARVNFIKIYKSCIFCIFQPFLRRSFILKSLMSEPLTIWILSVRSSLMALILIERHHSQN